MRPCRRAACLTLLGMLLAPAQMGGVRAAWASEPAIVPPRWLPNSEARPLVVRPRLEVPPAPDAHQVQLPAAAPLPFFVATKKLHVPARLRLMVFAPHPDDETLAAGGLIQRTLATGGEARVVFMTDGDGYVDGVRLEVRRAHTSQADFIAYGKRRHAEALRALIQLGLRQSDGVFLGFPDDGIDDLWASYWSPANPYRSPYTRLDHPPYKHSLRRRVEYAGTDLEEEIIAALRQFQPDWVVMPDPRDQHPDHCTTGVFVLDALRKLRQEGDAPFGRAQVFTYLVHYPGYPGLPTWVKAIESAGVGGSPAARGALSATQWLDLPLTAGELAGKQRVLSGYHTQMQVMNTFLKLFLRPFELFGQLDAAQVTAVPVEYAARFRRPKGASPALRH